jgi:hypothetical protein
MQPLLSTSENTSGLPAWRRPFWLGLLIVSTIALSFAFACAVPFAAIAAACALTLSRRDALVVVAGTWAANQLIGFLFLQYPQDAATFQWGAALGVIAVCSLVAAGLAAARVRALPVAAGCVVAFAAAFAAYEASLYAFSLLLGGLENITVETQARVLAIDVCAFIGLFAVNHLGASLKIAPQYRAA